MGRERAAAIDRCQRAATTWERDAAGRVLREIRADGLTTTTYTYDTTTSRLKTLTDPKQQVTTYAYNLDDTVASTVYTNAQIATPSVSLAFLSARGPHPHAGRSSAPLVAPAAGARPGVQPGGDDGRRHRHHRVHVSSGGRGWGRAGCSVDGPLPNDTITYTYDERGGWSPERSTAWRPVRATISWGG